ncbi:Signal transduction histidine kinase [Anaerorhabdus furcosa]|uniref:Signal transduction histidine kinase n=2 Tax=Anaerorhabdus furcosa TaxID=118967 RepID=A0A1T4QKM5_9FIRM|nr:Signal transduction histidine kinase [Anaerorhabdus furcosa]
MVINKQMLCIVYSVCIFLSLYTMYLGFRKIFKIKKSKIISSIFILFTSVILSIGISIIPNLPATYTFAFFLITMLYCGGFKFSLNQSFFVGCFYVFHLMAFKGIVLGSMSLILKINTFMVLQDVDYNMMAIIIIQILLFITFIIYIQIMKIQNIRSFLINRKQLIHVLGCHIAILLFMIFNTFTYYYNLELVWVSISQIMISIILYVIYMVVLDYGTHIADLLQHKMRDQKQLETIQSQLRQQNSLLKITDIVNVFKHDYREQMLTIEECIENNRLKDAINVLQKNCLFQLDKLPHTQKYSNNVIINSLLINRQEICDEKDIQMDAIVFYPQDLSITERDLHEVLRVVSDNAIDANEKLDKEKRFMNLKSNVEKQWLNIHIENPYSGVILFDGERPVSSYEREDDEGMGLIYVEELLEKHDGIIRYENDKKNKIFSVYMLIRIDG